MPESESAAESATTEQPDCSQLHQTIAALRKQVVESAASSSVSSVRIDQLQRELTGARGVIEQLQLQLQQAQMQPIRWPSRSASAAARPPVADPLERLRLRLRQCEAERDQYSAMCTRLQHALDNVVGGAGGEGMGGADGSAVGDADGSALHGQNNVHTEGRTSEEVTRETAAKCSTLLRSEGRGGISPEKHLLPWFLEEMLWVTQLQLRMASEIPLGQQRASLDRFAAPGCAPDGESDGGSGCNCVHESSPQPSSMSEAFRSAHRLLSELRDTECQPSEHGTALPPAYS